MSKAYDDAKKELEKIVTQRRKLIDSSKTRRSHQGNVNKMYPSELDDVNRSSTRISFSDSLNISTPLVRAPPPVNVYFRNVRHEAFSSRAMTPLSAMSARDSEPSFTPTNLSFSGTGNQAHLGTASTVIGTFRQLQAKARKVELERSDALKERDNLRQQVEDHSNDLKLWKRQSEQHTTEQFEAMKNATEELLFTRRALELLQLSLQEAFSSSQHSNSADRAVLLSLATEKGDIGSIMHTVKSNIKALEGELSIISNRLNRTAGQAGPGSPGTQQHTHDLEKKILKTTKEMKNIEEAKAVLDVRCGSLQYYMELILKINDDLTHRIEKNDILPGDSRNVPQGTLSAEHGRITSGLVNENIDPNTALDRGRGRGGDPIYSTAMTREMIEAISALRKARIPSTSATSTSTSTSKDRIVPRGQRSFGLNSKVHNTTRQHDRSGSGMRNLDPESVVQRQLEGSISMSARARKGCGDEGGALFSWDAAYRSLSTDPTQRRALSAHPRGNVQSTLPPPAPVPIAPSSTTVPAPATGVAKEKKTRVPSVRCRGASALSANRAAGAEPAVGHSGQTQRMSRSHSPPHRPNRTACTTVSNAPEGPTSRGGSRGRGGDMDRGGERDRSGDRGMQRNRGGSGGRGSASSMLRNGDFIPGGCTDGKEFNAYANSSKIAKAAIYCSTTLSSRVKAS